MAQQAACPLCQRQALTQSIWDPMVTRVICEACGRYDISLGLGLQGIDQRLNDVGRPSDKHLLSALARQASDRGQRITISNESILALLESAPRLSVLDQMNRVLTYVGERQKRADTFFSVPVDADWPQVFARDQDEFTYLLGTIVKRGFLEYPPDHSKIELRHRLTPEGWSEFERVRKMQPDSNQAFVAMWFDPDMDIAYSDGIKPALELVDYKPLNMKLLEHNDKIDDRIVAEIRRSGLLVADLTGNRGGVYFEAGFALGLGIPVVWTCKDTDLGNVHFDTSHYNFVVWAEPGELKAKLVARIEATIPGRVVKR